MVDKVFKGPSAGLGKVLMADTDGSLVWDYASGAIAAVQTDHGFTAYTSHFGPSGVDYFLNQITILNTAHIYPIVLSRPTSISELFCSVTTAFGGAGTTVKYGLWADNGKGWPGVRLASGSVSVGAAATGPMIYTISPAIVLKPGVYFVGMEAENGGLKCLGINASGQGAMGWCHAIAGSVNLVRASGIAATIDYAAFPPDPYLDAGNAPINYYYPQPVTFLTGVYV